MSKAAGLDHLWVLHVILFPVTSVIGLTTNAILMGALSTKRKWNVTDTMFFILTCVDFVYALFTLLGSIPRFIMMFDKNIGNDIYVTLLPVFYMFIYSMPSYVNKAMTALLSVERTIAVYWPTHYRAQWTRRRALGISGACSFLVVTLGVSTSLRTMAVHKDDSVNTTSPGTLATEFTELYITNKDAFNVYNKFYQFTFGFVPIIIVVVMNLATVVRLRHQQKKIAILEESALKSTAPEPTKSIQRFADLSSRRSLDSPLNTTSTMCRCYDVNVSDRFPALLSVPKDDVMIRNTPSTSHSIATSQPRIIQRKVQTVPDSHVTDGGISADRTELNTGASVCDEHSEESSICVVSYIGHGDPSDVPRVTDVKFDKMGHVVSSNTVPCEVSGLRSSFSIDTATAPGHTHSSRRATKPSVPTRRLSQTQKHTTVTLLIVSAVFLVFNLPSKLVFMSLNSRYTSFAKSSSRQLEVYIAASLFLDLLNSILNSIIFVARSPKYKLFVRDTFRCCRGR